jgi:hypothetical protein
MSEVQTQFELRGWGIRVWNSFDRFEEAADRAIKEAAAHGVTTIDIHDGTVPPGIGWVDLFAEYRQVQALRDVDVLTFHGRQTTRNQRLEYRDRFRKLCQRMKENGLRIHVWHHVLRDLPEEWLEIEPNVSRLEGRRLWQILGGMVDDFLTAVPEVDALTVTAQQALTTGGIDAAALASGERLRAIYQCLYETCRRQRRDLVVREVGATEEEKEAFLYAVGPLPPDIKIMVKDVQGDWYHLNAPLNPILYRLRNKNIIVESDLYGEHWGHLEVPLCRVREIHGLIRSWRHLPIVGAIGRIKVEQEPNSPRIHVFDTPNAANVAAFGHLLRTPLSDLDNDFTNVDAFDLRLWLDWLHERYGENASPDVIAALDRTSRIIQRVFFLGGAYFQHRSYLPSPTEFERQLWPTFRRQAGRLGVEVLRWEKEVALRLVRQSLGDIELAGPTLQADAREELLRGFEQARDVGLAYRVLIDLCVERLNSGDITATVDEALDLANRIESVRGEDFFGFLPERLRQLAQYMKDVTRGAPIEQPQTDDMELTEIAYDDEVIDLEGLSPT